MRNAHFISCRSLSCNTDAMIEWGNKNTELFQKKYGKPKNE